MDVPNALKQNKIRSGRTTTMCVVCSSAIIHANFPSCSFRSNKLCLQPILATSNSLGKPKSRSPLCHYTVYPRSDYHIFLLTLHAIRRPPSLPALVGAPLGHPNTPNSKHPLKLRLALNPTRTVQAHGTFCSGAVQPLSAQAIHTRTSPRRLNRSGKHANDSSPTLLETP